jgi:hypothetical protein
MRQREFMLLMGSVAVSRPPPLGYFGTSRNIGVLLGRSRENRWSAHGSR